MLGWVICRIHDDYEDGQSLSQDVNGLVPSIFNQIYDLTYGILNDGDFPPTSNWVFLAKGTNFFFIFSLLKL